MERTLLVIRVFSSLIKVEHHRSFLEFCRYNNTIPVGLRLKKSSSCYGERNFEFEDSWNNVLQATEKQLLSILLLRYREDVVRIEANAQEVIDNHRRYLSREEMVHIRERLKDLYNSCRERRFRKARMMMGENGLDQEGLNWLETTPHVAKDSLSLEGLPYGRAIESQVVQRGVSHSRENHATVGGSGRLRGRFIDGMWSIFQEEICYQEKWHSYQRD